MAKNISNIARGVRDLLVSSGLPRTEWNAVLTEVLDQPSPLDRSLAGAIATRHAVGVTKDASGLPALPSGLEWPTEQFNQSPEYRTKDGIIHHLERVWRPLIEVGVIDMPMLRFALPVDGKGNRQLYLQRRPATQPTKAPYHPAEEANDGSSGERSSGA